MFLFQLYCKAWFPCGRKRVVTVVEIGLQSNSEILDCFEIYLQNFDKENKETITTGDFNIDQLPNDTQHSKLKRFVELLNTYQLSQVTNKPTRITESTETLLDLIICKTDDRSKNYCKECC